MMIVLGASIVVELLTNLANPIGLDLTGRADSFLSFICSMLK